jgi:L-ascorbate metabolism protein UlaG (beta-lactamase superfamily)
MKIKYLAHSSFLLTAASGTRIITDPYTVNDHFKYSPISEAADIVTVTHGHGDHNNVAAVKGSPQVVKESAEVKGVRIKTVPTMHDASGGKERGQNIIFCFDIDGVKVVHCGDLGHLLTDNQVVEVGKVHVLLIPVGGYYTIDARTAQEVADQVRARVIIPMHYKTDKTGVPIVGVEDFIKNKTNVTMVDGSEVEFKPGEVSAGPQIMVLKPALL